MTCTISDNMLSITLLFESILPRYEKIGKVLLKYEKVNVNIEDN